MRCASLLVALAAFVAFALASESTLRESASPAPFVGTIAASLDTWNDFALVSFAADGKSKMITNLTNVGGLLPMESAYVAHLNAVAFLTVGAKSGAVIVSTKGQLIGVFYYSTIVLTNIEYDISLKAIYVIGYVPSVSKNYLWQLFPNGTLTQIVYVPGTVQLSMSTYCQNSHTFFVTVETNSNSMNGLIRIDTQGKKVSPLVNLDDSVEMIFWDYTAAVMYAMVATETQAALLVTINIESGKRNSTIVGFSNLSSNPNDGAGAAFNIKTKVITGAFIDIADQALPPYWVTINTQSGNFTSHKYDYGYAINVLVNAPQ